MSQKPATFQLNPKEVFEALGMSISGISEDSQELIATFLAQSARSIKNTLTNQEREDDEGDVNSLIELNKSQGKKKQQQLQKKQKKDNKIESGESGLESNSSSDSESNLKSDSSSNSESKSKSDSSSDSDEKSSSNSESDGYISIAQKQVPKAGRIPKRQGKFVKIPFDLKGVTGVTQVGNLITISTSAQNSIFFNKIFNKGVWRIYFQIISGDVGNSAIGIVESSISDYSSSYLGFIRQGMHYASGGGIHQFGNSTHGSKSFSINDIIGFEVDMISHRIYFFHTFQQQPVCLINTPASLKITYGSSNGTQYKVVAVYKLKKPLAIAAKSPTVKVWSL
ncbi:MAG: hypothetical protein EZS28_013271 [Streblomastix strix]|uniref:B30.2/SPRY domain-containing protein n=1 Tax=Streblomastix strix TaxID=222440 RepID=A0A5J4W932_9EUKA|nr:MAG: hypothetical protein EZS28_013271 [Streblomastix strix]